MSRPPRERERPGIPLRAVIPNAVTALALCSGLSGIRFAITAEWDKWLMFVAIAAVLAGLDGRMARRLRGQSKFGAELDSLSDGVAFGVAPALITYLWTLRAWNPAYGWIVALAYAAGLALRLARFNARIDVEDQHPGRRLPMVADRPPDTAEGGRGLVITASLSSAWGVEYTRTNKRVWVVCERDDAPADLSGDS